MGKLGYLFAIWALTIVAYLIMAATIPAIRELTAEAAVELEASANMSNFPGTMGMVEAFPVYCWIIPALIAMVATVIVLKRNDDNTRGY